MNRLTHLIFIIRESLNKIRDALQQRNNALVFCLTLWLFPSLLTLPLYAGIISQTYYFDEPTITSKEGYDYVEMRDCFHLGAPTKPLLPSKQVRLLIPPGEEATEISVVASGKTRLGDGYRVYPCQYEIPVSLAHQRKFTQPDATIYASDRIFPSVNHANLDTGFYRGHGIAMVDIYPMEYIPLSGELSYFSSITVTISTATSRSSSDSFSRFYRSNDNTRSKVVDWVQNPGQLSLYPIQNPDRPVYPVTYLIITSSVYEDSFTEFIRFKRQQGFSVALETVQDIYSTYTGTDQQDKIRNCIIDYYINHDLEYVLLGGDVEIVLHRCLFGHVWLNADPAPEHHSDDVASDLYYGGLDRVGSGPGPDWNVDNDNKWGEVLDPDPAFGSVTEADFLTEVLVGRVAADSALEFSNALYKLISYQKNPVQSDNKKAIMVGQRMWAGYCGDEAKEEIRLGGTYDGYHTYGLANKGIVSQLQYAAAYPDSTWPVGDLILKMNIGATYMNHLGHGNVHGYMNFEVSDGSLDLLTADGRNHNHHFIYSQTCYGSSFDNRLADGFTISPTDCMTEYFTTHEKGVMAVVGNSRFGLSGSGQIFDRYFFDAMCKNTNPTNILGEMQQYSQINSGHDYASKRWTFYELNLFGDPALAFWQSSNLGSMNSVTVQTVPHLGMDHVTVQVGPAINGMRVSLCTDTGIFGTALTNSSGIATVYLSQGIYSEIPVYGMVTYDNYVPYEFITGWFPSTWTGNYSSNWNDSRNWMGGHLPNSTKDVVIPSVYGFDPMVSYSNATCRALTVKAGASLAIRNFSLTTSGDAKIYGNVDLENTSATLDCNGDLWLYNGADLSMASYSYMYVTGDFHCLTSLELNAGTVFMNGPDDAYLSTTGGYDMQFWGLSITKSNAEVCYAGEFTGDLIVKSTLYIGPTAVLTNDNDNNDIECWGNISGKLQLDHGTLTYKGGNSLLNMGSGGYVNDLKIYGTGTLSLISDLEIKGDLSINLGTFDANDNTINLHGNWSNLRGTVGFVEDESIVKFIGNTDQMSSTETFNRVVLSKVSGQLIISSGKTINCSEYDWAIGTMRINQGSFTAADVLDTGIQGNYYVQGGYLELNQDASATVDFNCNMTIDGSGTVKIMGGNGNPSRWSYLRNAQLIMTGGSLDFPSSGISMANYGHTMSCIITGGTISTAGDFNVSYGDFSPSGGLVKLNGNSSTTLSLNSISNLYNLYIQKHSINNTVTVQSAVEVQADVNVWSGTLKLNSSILSVNNDLNVDRGLTLDSADQVIEIGGDLLFDSGSQISLSSGTISLEGNYTNKTANWSPNPGFILNLTGSGVSLVKTTVSGFLGTLQVAKNAGGSFAFDSTSLPFTLSGNLELESGSVGQMVGTNVTILGTMLIESGAQFQVGGASISPVLTTFNLNLSGTFVLNDGIVDILTGYVMQTSGSLTVNGGSFLIDSPYTGALHSFAGVTEINDGAFQITNNGMQFGASSDFTINGGTVKIGWGIRAAAAGAFLQNSGTIELVGNRVATIDIVAGNHFHDLLINKSPASTAVYTMYDIEVGNDLTVNGGYLTPMAHDLTVNGNITISGGRISSPTDDHFIYCGGDWDNGVGSNGFAEGTGTVVFTGGNRSYILSYETFYNLTIDRSASHELVVDESIFVTVANSLDLQNGELEAGDGAELLIQGDLLIEDGGCLYVPGNTEISIQVAGNAEIMSGGSLIIYGLNSFTVEGDFTLYGEMYISQAIVNVHGEPYLGNTSVISITQGYVNFDVPDSRIWILSMGHISVNGGELRFPNRGIQFLATSSFSMDSGYMTCGGDFYALAPSVFTPTGGSIRFINARPHIITCSNGNNFPSLAIDCAGGSVSLGTALDVRGDVLISGGTLYPGGQQLRVFGSWNNLVGDAGFGDSGTTVTFAGTANTQIISNEKFYNLVVDKAVSNQYCLTIPSGITVQVGGSLNLTNGMLHVSDNANLDVALDVNIAAGAGLNIVGFSDPALLYIGRNLTDLNTELEWMSGFNAAGMCTVTFDGIVEQTVSSNRASLQFHNLVVNKSSGEFVPVCGLVVTGDLDLIRGTWTFQQEELEHTFYNNFSVQSTGHWMDNYGTVILAGDSNVGFSIAGTSQFGSITIDKAPLYGTPNNVTVTLSGLLNALEGGEFEVVRGVFDLNGNQINIDGAVLIDENGELLVGPGSQLRLYGGSYISVNNGGLLSVMGTSGQAALISHYLSGYYSLDVNSGGGIAAVYAVFEYMDQDGVNVKNGSTVDPDHSFAHCTFRNGGSGGVLLTINNGQFLTLPNVIFPANTWGSWYNVRKSWDQGSLSFEDESGDFSLPWFENDPYMRINWSSEIPLIAVDATSFNFGEVGILQEESRWFNITNDGTGNLIGTINTTDEFLVYTYRGGEDPHASKEETPSRYGVDFIVNPGFSMMVEVRFRPQLPVTYNATIVIEHNADSPPVEIGVSGTGIGGAISYTPHMIMEGILPNGTHAETLYIENTGNDTLSYHAYVTYPRQNLDVILSEGFESGFPPSGWTETQVSGTMGDWNRYGNTHYPSGYSVHGGSWLGYFNSYTCYAGNQTRLETGNLSFSGYTSSYLAFWMYHDPGYIDRNDRIQIQVFHVTSGWQNVGSPILRPYATSGWQYHYLDLSAYDGQDNLRIGFLGISEYGNDIHIDDIEISGEIDTSNWITLNGLNSVSNSLEPGDPPDEVAILVNTAGLDVGMHTAQIHLDSSDPMYPDQWIPVEVEIGVPSIAVSPPTLDFGAVHAGSDSTMAFYIEADGEVSINGTISAPDGFQVSSSTGMFPGPGLSARSSGGSRNLLEFHLMCGETREFGLTFSPLLPQTYSGNVVISCDNLAPVNLPVTGDGIDSPLASTLPPTEIHAQTAVLHGEVTSTGNLPILDRGFFYATHAQPEAGGTQVSVTGPANPFEAEVSGLIHNYEYFYCAYATNELGTDYGPEESFFTATPHLDVSITGLDFGPQLAGTVSDHQSFTISGQELVDMVMLSVLQGFELSLSPGRDRSRIYSNSLNLYPVDGVLPETTVYVRFTPDQAIDYNEQVSILTVGANSCDVALTGRGVDYPSVSTLGCSDVTASSAVLYGELLDSGNDFILACGFCWSTEPDPDLSDGHIDVGIHPTAFNGTAEGLDSNTLYYYRAWAQTAAGVGYGNVLYLNTSLQPEIFTSVSALPDFGTICAGYESEPLMFTVSADELAGPLTIVAGGEFEFMALRNRDYVDSLDLYPEGTGIPETTIYVRFAPTVAGPATGAIELSSPGADTQQVDLSGTGVTTPSVLAVSVIPLTGSSVTVAAEITDTGYGTVSACGICWGEGSGPDILGSHTDEGSQSGAFQSQIDGLVPGYTYYYRAWAENEAGLVYSNELSFATANDPQIVIEHDLQPFGSIAVGDSTLAQSVFLAGSELTGPIIVATTAGFEIAEAEIRTGDRRYGSLLEFDPYSGSVAFTEIYVRFAPETPGVYSGTLTFSYDGNTVLEIPLSGTGFCLPELNTLAVTDIGFDSATIQGEVLSDGFSPLTAVGVCWSVSPGPTTADSVQLLDPVSWTFALPISGFSPNQLYYVRTFAANAAGTAYGNELSFTTSSGSVSAPAGLSIRIEDGDLILSWDEVPGTTGYRVYASDASDAGTGVWELVQTITGPGPCSLPLCQFGAYKFFYVTALIE
jgi:hypothetical protein